MRLAGGDRRTTGETMDLDTRATGAQVTPPAIQPPPLPPGPPPVPPPPAPTRHPLQFTGRTGEFFGIWFVNLVLSVLTLGIYSAWAKLRTQRYFYGNTWLGGAPFEYLARPIAILKGRLVAYAVAIVLGLSAHFQIWLVYLPMILLVLLLLPWLLQRTLRFRARYSAWRGLRFRFDHGVFDAYVNFMFIPALQLITFYLLALWVRMQQQEYVVTGHRFGGQRFGFRGDLGSYYIPFLICIGIGIGAYVAMVVAVAVGVAIVAALAGGEEPSGLAMAGIMLPVFSIYLVFLALPVFLRTRWTNLMWASSWLGQHRFECTLRARDVIWIYFSNGLAIVFSLGLAVPWAMVRIARYRARHWTLLAAGDLDSFVADAH